MTDDVIIRKDKVTTSEECRRNLVAEYGEDGVDYGDDTGHCDICGKLMGYPHVHVWREVGFDVLCMACGDPGGIL